MFFGLLPVFRHFRSPVPYHIQKAFDPTSNFWPAFRSSFLGGLKKLPYGINFPTPLTLVMFEKKTHEILRHGLRRLRYSWMAHRIFPNLTRPPSHSFCPRNREKIHEENFNPDQRTDNRKKYFRTKNWSSAAICCLYFGRTFCYFYHTIFIPQTWAVSLKNLTISSKAFFNQFSKFL